MIQFKLVRYKNMLSTGNAWTEVVLDSHKSTLIVGDNGAGKSTMLDAICFAIYGKPFRKINKPQLVNSINGKGLEVEVLFHIGADKFMIKRGIKPALFEIWKNDKLLNQDAAARDYQSYLEENVLKMNFKSFGQVVVLGSSTFVPFMQLPAATRREVIEDLLDIQIFTTMNSLLKEQVHSNKEEVAELKHTIDLVKNRLQSAKDHNEEVRRLKETEVSKIKERAKQQLELIDTETQSVESVEVKIDELVSAIADKSSNKSKLSEIQEVDRKLETKFKQLTKDTNFYEGHDNCPTCRQGIEHDFKERTIHDNRSKIEQITDGRAELAVKAKVVEDRLQIISDIEDEISKTHLDASTHRANIKMAKGILTTIKKELEGAQKEVETIGVSKIKELEDEYKSYTIKQERLINDKEVLSVVSAMLKDGGIKTRIIKQYVPVMNKLINKYLAAMDFFVDFQLDESFNETIKSRFRDVFSYASFSEGEKLRITLSIMLAWRSVAKLRNSVSTNLLLLDETLDGALDGVGIEHLIETLHSLNADDNVFVISHRGDQFVEKFAGHIKFTKVKNFSEVA